MIRLYWIGGLMVGVLLSQSALADPGLYGQWQGTL